jgi:hypothetical protein
MAKTSDLTGLGMAPALAGYLNEDVSTVAGVGTSQTGAAPLTTPTTILTTTGGQTAFILPSGTSNPGLTSIGNELVVYNTSSTTALIFPPVSGTLNGGSSSLSVAQNKGASFRVTSNPGGSNIGYLSLAGA